MAPSTTAALSQRRLIFSEGTKLQSYQDGTRSVLVEIPSADVVLSPDGSRWAAIRETDFSRRPEEDGFNAPEIVVGDLDGRSPVRVLGPGSSPSWSPDGATIAAISPEDGRVVLFPSVQRGQPSTAIGEGEWSILGWATDNRIIAASRTSGAVVLGVADSSGKHSELPFTVSEVWGVSPAQDRILLVRRNEMVVSDLVGGRDLPIDLGGALLGDGTWARDGRTIAAAAIDARPGGGATSRLVLIDVFTGTVQSVAGSRGAQGNVVWSSDATVFAYAKIHDDRTELRAVICSVDPLDCVEAFSWRDGVKLLGLA